MEKIKGIYLGNDTWIDWINIEPTDRNNFLDADDLINPTYDFWDNLETVCLAECCGINAYNFEKETIKLALTKVDKTALFKNLLHLKTTILNSNKTIISTVKLNHLINKTVFIRLLDHILTTIEQQETD